MRANACKMLVSGHTKCHRKHAGTHVLMWENEATAIQTIEAQQSFKVCPFCRVPSHGLGYSIQLFIVFQCITFPGAATTWTGTLQIGSETLYCVRRGSSEHHHQSPIPLCPAYIYVPLDHVCDMHQSAVYV
jgi:hypothetical protein